MQRPENPSESCELDIFLVEDNPGDVILFKQALRGTKICYSLNLASDGAEAIRRLDQGYCPDVAFLDLNLPCRSGTEILAMIKSNPELSPIPVVILTGSNAAEDRALCEQLGAALFLQKAAALEDFVRLADTIREFLSNIQPARLPAIPAA